MRAPALLRPPGRPRRNAGACGRLCGGVSLFTLSGGPGEDAGDPIPSEVNEMMVVPTAQPDPEAQSQTPDERTCETTPEETNRSVLLGAAGNRATGEPGRPAGRPEGIHTRSTRTRSGRKCGRGCASWPGSSPAPTWSRRLAGEQPAEPAPRCLRTAAIAARPYHKTARNVMPREAL